MSSASRRKLTTNYVPNSRERNAIEDSLTKMRQKHHSLAAKISQHQAVLCELLQHRDAANHQLITYNAFIAPIRRLPPEILQTVFLYCLPVDRHPVMSRQEAPVLLGRVCSHWRAIAYTTSRLWKAIHVVIPAISASSRSYHEGRTKAIIQWLSRAGSHPLDISVYSVPGFNVSSQAYILQGYLDTFLPSMSRWKSIRLSLPGGDLWEDFLLRIKESDVPLLELLYIDRRSENYDDSESIVDAAKATGLIRAPKLHSLSMPGFKYFLEKLPIHWAKLREVDLSNNTSRVEDTIEILSMCHNLCYISIRVGRTRVSIPDPIPNLTFPKLLGFTVIDGSMTDTAQLFDRLYLPTLRHLSYSRASIGLRSLQKTNRAIFIRALSSLFYRNACPLEELELHTGCLLEQDVRMFLSICPSIKRLALLLPSISDPRSRRYYGHRRFTLQDKDLREFIPKSLCDDELEQTLSSSSDSRSTSTASSSPSWSSYEEVSDSSSPTNEPDTQCLCPNLEIFHCAGASFSDAALIDFLQSRSTASIAPNQSDSPITSPLRRVNIEFEVVRRPPTKSARKKIEKLKRESNMVVNITYRTDAVDSESNTDSAMAKYSPYDGIARDIMMDQLSSSYGQGGVGYFGF